MTSKKPLKEPLKKQGDVNVGDLIIKSKHDKNG
jgi:hypothetical protein